MRGVDKVCQALLNNGAETVFGLPGTQNITLFDAIKRSTLKVFTSSSEMNAAFAANGYARSSGKPGVLAIIPGPGFTYALTGIAEARLDSVPLVCLIGEPAKRQNRAFQLQQIDQQAIVSPLVKAYHKLNVAADCDAVINRAFRDAMDGEPGPVVVELSSDLNAQDPAAVKSAPAAAPVTTPAPEASSASIAEIAAALSNARRPLLFLGQGAMNLGGLVERLQAQTGAAVIATTSGRGVISEANHSVLSTDLRDASVINALIDHADLVLALGVKLSHNGCCGFEMRLPADRFIHVDADASVPGANYPARLSLVSALEPFLLATLQHLDGKSHQSEWTDADFKTWQARLDATDVVGGVNPQVADMRATGMPEFFALLRSKMPAGAQLVCDSGMHQMLARRHYPVFEPGGLLVPTDFQSMGYGIPAAIGAKIAYPQRAVAALIGDGGLAINGLDITSAVRDKLALPVFVFVDGHFGLIRHQQVENFGSTTEVKLPYLSVGALAEAMNAAYALADDDLGASIETALAASVPTLIEVRLAQTAGMRLHEAKRSAVESVQRTLGPQRSKKLKDMIRRLLGKT